MRLLVLNVSKQQLKLKLNNLFKKFNFRPNLFFVCKGNITSGLNQVKIVSEAFKILAPISWHELLTYRCWLGRGNATGTCGTVAAGR